MAIKQITDNYKTAVDTLRLALENANHKFKL